MMESLKNNSIDKQIEMCNKMLLEMEKPSISKLEQSMNVGKDSLRKRFKSNGYIYDKSIFQFVLKMDEEDEIDLENIEDLDLGKLQELIKMIEPLKELVGNDSVKVNSNINVSPIGEIQTKVFKIDKKVLKRWDKFVKSHKEYKVQQLITQALVEFMDNH